MNELVRVREREREKGGELERKSVRKKIELRDVGNIGCRRFSLRSGNNSWSGFNGPNKYRPCPIPSIDSEQIEGIMANGQTTGEESLSLSHSVVFVFAFFFGLFF